VSVAEFLSEGFINSMFLLIVKYTGCFIMFSVITNFYNQKTKGLTLMEFFTATGKRVCEKNLNIVSMCAASLVVHT